MGGNFGSRKRDLIVRNYFDEFWFDDLWKYCFFVMGKLRNIKIVLRVENGNLFFFLKLFLY